MYGRLTKPGLAAILDLSPREVALFAPLLVLSLWMGIFPSSFTGFFDATVNSIVEHHHAALATATKLAQAVQ
jgi:NADH-quinone oxidoreductase subunit M